MATMNLTRFAQWYGVSSKTAQRWFHDGNLPYPARRVGRLIMVEVPDEPATGRPAGPSRAVVYSSSPGVTTKIRKWALRHGIQIDDTYQSQQPQPSTSPDPTLKQLLADPTVTRIVTDSHPDAELLSAALSAHGREFITTQPATTAHTFKPRFATSTGA